MRENLTNRAKELLAALPIEMWLECEDGQMLLHLADHKECKFFRVNSTLGRFEPLTLPNGECRK